MSKTKYWKNLASLRELIKIHKKKLGSLFELRFIINHSHSITKAADILLLKFFRRIRFLCMKKRNIIPIIENVCDFVHRVQCMKKRICDEKLDIDSVAIITIDMKSMYPNTKLSFVLQSLRALASMLFMDTRLVSCICALLRFLNRFAFFTHDGVIYRQSDGQMIGSCCAGDVCDTVYYYCELLHWSTITGSVFVYGRYRDDICFYLSERDPVRARSTVDHLLAVVFPDFLRFTIDISYQSAAFLDCTVFKNGGTLETRVYHKPGNARAYSKFTSNVPRSTINSIVCGLMKRYIIICSNEKDFIQERDLLFTILSTRCGWPPYFIRAVKRRPAFANRMQYINDYMNGRDSRIDAIAKDHINKFTVVFDDEEVEELIIHAGVYNHMYDDQKSISNGVATILNAINIQDFTICNKGESTINTLLYKKSGYALIL